MTLWAIQITPLSGRGKPWINHLTLSRLRGEAWQKLYEGGTDKWRKTINLRKRKGLMRAVKVTIQIKER